MTNANLLQKILDNMGCCQLFLQLHNSSTDSHVLFQVVSKPPRQGTKDLSTQSNHHVFNVKCVDLAKNI